LFAASFDVHFRFVSDFRKEDSRLFRKIRHSMPEVRAGRPEHLVAAVQIRSGQPGNLVDQRIVDLKEMLEKNVKKTGLQTKC
jgi:hypothetical protein